MLAQPIPDQRVAEQSKLAQQGTKTVTSSPEAPISAPRTTITCRPRSGKPPYRQSFAPASSSRRNRRSQDRLALPARARYSVRNTALQSSTAAFGQKNRETDRPQEQNRSPRERRKPDLPMDWHRSASRRYSTPAATRRRPWPACWRPARKKTERHHPAHSAGASDAADAVIAVGNPTSAAWRRPFSTRMA